MIEKKLEKDFKHIIDLTFSMKSKIQIDNEKDNAKKPSQVLSNLQKISELAKGSIKSIHDSYHEIMSIRERFDLTQHTNNEFDNQGDDLLVIEENNRKIEPLPLNDNPENVIKHIFDDVRHNGSANDKEELLALAKKEVSDLEFQIKNPGVALLPEVGDGSYELFKPRTDAYIHLRDNWGQWLTHFNDYFSKEENGNRPPLKRDYLSQEMLGKYDPKMLAALRNASKRNTLIKGKDYIVLADIAPPDKVLKQLELDEMPQDEIRKAYRITTALSRRKAPSLDM